MSKYQQRINRLKEVLESDDCDMTDSEKAEGMNFLLVDFYNTYKRHLYQKGKNGIFAPFADAEDFAKQTIDEIIRRKRGKHE